MSFCDMAKMAFLSRLWPCVLHKMLKRKPTRMPLKTEDIQEYEEVLKKRIEAREQAAGRTEALAGTSLMH